MKSLIRIVLIAAVSSVATSAANAAKISGELFFASAGTSTLVGGNYATATAINFGGVHVVAGTNDYATIPGGTSAAFNNVTFGPVGTTGTVTVNPLWTVINGPTYSFSLTEVTLNSVIGTARVIEGKGIATITGGGFEPTNGTWQISTSGTKSKITFSSYSSVPESGSALPMFGLGLIDLACFRRIWK